MCLPNYPKFVSIYILVAFKGTGEQHKTMDGSWKKEPGMVGTQFGTRKYILVVIEVYSFLEILSMSALGNLIPFFSPNFSHVAPSS